MRRKEPTLFEDKEFVEASTKGEPAWFAVSFQVTAKGGDCEKRMADSGQRRHEGFRPAMASQDPDFGAVTGRRWQEGPMMFSPRS